MVTSRIIDPTTGQPFPMEALREPQTAKVGSLQNEWQGHPAKGLTPSKLASVLLNAEQGDIVAQYELFEDMEERDAHIFAEMGKRRRAVSGVEWDIVPPPNASAAEKAAATKLKELLDSVDDIEGALFDTTDAIGKGFTCQELEWDFSDRTWLPKNITFRPQSWFRLHRGYTQEIRLRDNTAEGQLLQPFGWLTHTHKARSGYLERANLFRVLVWPYLFKNYSVADLAEFLEIYGIPMRVGKYPPGASDKEKNALLRALIQIGHNAAGIIPDGMVLEFKETATGEAEAFEVMFGWCERSQSKAILGGTLTSQADGKSSTNALGNVHNEVRKELKDSDAKQLAASWTRDLIYPIALLNGLAPGGLRRCPRFKLDTSESKDLGAYASALPPLVNLGLRIPRAWAHEELGIPEAEEGEEILTRATAAVPPETPGEVSEQDDPGTPAKRPPLRAAATAQSPSDPPLRMVPRLDKDVDLGTWVAQIRSLVDQAGSLEEVRDKLLELYPTMTLDQYADAMAMALGAAQLAGRSAVQDGTNGFA
jgi:phage gp29-like protein